MTTEHSDSHNGSNGKNGIHPRTFTHRAAQPASPQAELQILRVGAALGLLHSNAQQVQADEVLPSSLRNHARLIETFSRSYLKTFAPEALTKLEGACQSLGRYVESVATAPGKGEEFLIARQLNELAQAFTSALREWREVQSSQSAGTFFQL